MTGPPEGDIGAVDPPAVAETAGAPVATPVDVGGGALVTTGGAVGPAETVAVGPASARRFVTSASSSFALVTALAHGGGAPAGNVSAATRS